MDTLSKTELKGLQMDSETSNRLAMRLVVLPLVLLTTTITLFTGLMFFVPLNKAELDLSATITGWSCGGFLVWLVVGIIVYKSKDPAH